MPQSKGAPTPASGTLRIRHAFAIGLIANFSLHVLTGFAAVALNADSNAPKNAKVLSKPVHLRELVNEVQKMLAA